MGTLARPAAPALTQNVVGSSVLNRSGGCGDAFVYATNSDGSLAVTVNWAQAASRAQSAGQFEGECDAAP